MTRFFDADPRTSTILEPVIPQEAPAEVSSEQNPTRQTLDWTIMVYLCADNNLDAVGYQDFNDMETVGSTDDVNIIVAADFDAHFSDQGIYNVTYDTSGTINSQYIAAFSPDCGLPGVLLGFIQTAQSFAPANNYLLILWNHGAGYPGVCFDDDPGGNWLTMAEIESVLADPSITDVDIVAFDACLMAQIEVAYQLVGETDYVVFSEDTIPLSGFPYQEWLPDVVNSPSITPASLCTQLVTRYHTAYNTGGIYYDPNVGNVGLSAVQTSSIGAVGTALDTFSSALLPTATLEAQYGAISYAIGQAQAFTDLTFIDLGGFASAAAGAITDATIAGYASALNTAHLTAVTDEAHLSGLPGSTGMAIAFEDHGAYSLDLLTDTDFDEFLGPFLDIGETQYTAFNVSSGYCYGYLEGTGDNVFFSYTAATSGSQTFNLDAMQNTGVDFDLYLYSGAPGSLVLMDSDTSPDSDESVTGTLTSGTTYYIRVASYGGAGAFQLALPGAGAGGIPLLLILVIVAVIIIVIVIVVVVCLIRRRGA